MSSVRGRFSEWSYNWDMKLHELALAAVGAAFLGSLVLGFVLCSSTEDRESNRRSIDARAPLLIPTRRTPEPETKEPPIPKPISVSAKQLFADYQANEVRADDRYKGRALLVSGRVDSIGKDLGTDAVVVHLKTSSQIYTVCTGVPRGSRKAPRFTCGATARAR